MYRRALGFISTLGFLTVALASRPAQAGELANAASGLSAGSFVEVAAIGMKEAFTKTDGSGGNALGYSDSVKWDPVTKQIFYIGMDHNQTDGDL